MTDQNTHAPENSFTLGMNYLRGDNGCPQDDEQAAKHLLDAANLGHAEAQFELAKLYQYLNRIEESDNWFMKSVDLGWGPAIAAYLEECGRSLPYAERSALHARARAWFLARASTGNPEYQVQFALFLKDGNESLYWLQRAVEQGYENAFELLGRRYLTGDISEATHLAIHWLTRAADSGSRRSAEILGDIYLEGYLDSNLRPRVRLTPNKTKAVEWYERSISMGNRYLAYKLGTRYLEGRALKQDLALAEKWLLHAANDGIPSAQEALGRQYMTGGIFPRDVNLALHWLNLATRSSGNVGLWVADLYLNGQFVPKSFSTAASRDA